jgi:hypothetical protein
MGLVDGDEGKSPLNSKKPGFLVRHKDLFNIALLTKAHQGRSKHRYCFPFLCVKVVSPHNTGKAHNDMGIALCGKIFSSQNLADP